jgi:hypothetical protein
MHSLGYVEDVYILFVEDAVENAQHLIGIVGPITDSPSAAMTILNYLGVRMKACRVIAHNFGLRHEFCA